MGKTTEVVVPDIGDFQDVPVIEVLVHPGDHIKEEDPLITLESDKASMDVPSPYTGVVTELRVSVGDKLSEGSPILTVERDDGEATEAPAPPREETQAASAERQETQAAPEEPAVARAPAGDKRVEEVRVPDIGDFHDVPIIEVMVQPGASVGREDPLVTLESDKASMDVPSPFAGVVKDLKVGVGDKVSEGSLLLTLETGAEARAPAPSQPPAAAAEESAAPAAAAPREEAARPATEAPTPATGEAPAAARPSPTAALEEAAPGERPRAHATPAVRRYARELGVDLTRVKGTGRKGRIRKEDVNSFVKQELGRPPTAAAAAGIPEMPAVDFGKFGPIESRSLSRIKKLSGANVHRSWLVVPHVTQHDEADITELEAFRKGQGEEAKKRGVRLTLLAFLMKAAVAALKAYPNFNSSLDPGGENLILKQYYHLGIAVDTPDGLVVPVIRDVDKKGIYELAEELAKTSERARDKKLSPTDMQGASFTISSLGGIGGTAFTPIVNAPEVAILGVSRSHMKPVWQDGEFVPRLMLPLALSYDHRVIDGAAAARFTTFLSGVLTDIRRLLL